jgi:hypothetical protein
MSVITLYHGSIYEFDKIDVNKGKSFKDFGIGFYTSRDENHAMRLALRNKQIEDRRFNKYHKKKFTTPWLYTYEIDLCELDKLGVKEFKKADREWVKHASQRAADLLKPKGRRKIR